MPFYLWVFAKVSYFCHKYFAKTKSEFSRKLLRKNENFRPNPSCHLCLHAYQAHIVARYGKIKKIPPLDSTSFQKPRLLPWDHRYLMSRLILQVFYLWHHVFSTALPLILWWSNLEILHICPLHRSSPFVGGLRWQAIQMEHGPYIAERTQKTVYIVIYLCERLATLDRAARWPRSQPLSLKNNGCGKFGSATRYTTHLSSTVLSTVLCDPLLLW
jgi:hypothetical protein